MAGLLKFYFILDKLFFIFDRYGREDEEVMGLKFCNEAIMSLAQIWPLHCNHDREQNTPLQVRLSIRIITIYIYIYLYGCGDGNIHNNVNTSSWLSD